MAAASWSAKAIGRILRGKKVRLPRDAPAHSAELIALARLALRRQTSPRRRRRIIVRAVRPMFNKRNIALAIDQADRGYRATPLIGPQQFVPVLLPFVGMGVALTCDWTVNLMADAFFRIAGIGRRDVGQRQRQRVAQDRHLAERHQPQRATGAPQLGHNRPPARLTFRLDEFSFSAAIFGPMGEVVRLVRRLSRL